MDAIVIKPTIGVGDALQFSSVPENYFKATGKKLYSAHEHWFFDDNPYLCRDKNPSIKRTIELWNFGPRKYDWPVPDRFGSRPKVYMSNAELHALAMGISNPTLNRPRLYRHEDFPFHQRENILLHVDGKSQGLMPEHIIQHVIKKYKPTGKLYQVGLSTIDLGLPRIPTNTLWDLARVISEARMFIGQDSGPSWIAACYPDVQLKVVRSRQTPDKLANWIPLEIENYHSHWDDRCRQVFNTSENDVGFTYSYRRI